MSTSLKKYLQSDSTNFIDNMTFIGELVEQGASLAKVVKEVNKRGLAITKDELQTFIDLNVKLGSVAVQDYVEPAKKK